MPKRLVIGRTIRAIMISSFILLGALLVTPLAISATQAATSSTMFDHVVVIMLENHSLNQIYGSSSAPYLTGLANTWSLAQGYTAVDHPSEPNYLALVSGLAGDCSNPAPNIGGCLSGGGDSTSDSGPTAPSGSYSSNAINIVDRLESNGLTWDAYFEGSSGGCDQSFGTAYHASLLFMNDIVSSSTRCSHIHSFSTTSPTNLVTELNGGGANLIWINPDNSHNMHDNSVSSGDTYMSTLIPQILGSTEFTTTKAVLFVTFDEGNNSYPSDYVYTVFAGPAAKLAYKSTSQYTHYSFLATLEQNWGLTCIVSTDCNATPMTEFFGPATPAPLSTSFTELPATPTVNSLVTFTAVTTGGTLPYSVSWSFGDGGTGTGTIVTHTYTSAKSFTITETAKDSSSPQQSATSSQTVTVVSSLTGNFGVCNSLPQGWNCGNLHPSAPSTSSAQIVTGVFESRQSNPGLGGSNDYYYSTTQKGTFPWTPCSAPASGVIPSGTTSVSVNFTSLFYSPGSSPSSDRYHIYIALYYWLPNGPVSAGGSTYQCLDTQVRVENIGGTFSAIGSTATYNPGDSFGWDNVTLQVSPGQSGLLTANVASQCLQDLKAWGLPTSTPCQLAGIEIGTEGYQFQELDVNWYFVSLNTSPPPPLTTDFSFTPSSPTTGQSVSFTSTASGGTAPYRYSWNFGDGTTGTGVSTVHTFASAQAFTVTETTTDSASPSQTATRSKIVTVVPTLLSTSFTFIPTNPLINSPVSFTSATTGGTLPYTITWNFGDGATVTGASTTHTYSSAQSFTVTETATDSSSPSQSAISSKTITISMPPPPSTSFTFLPASPIVNTPVTFTATTTGGTPPYSVTWNFGDGASGTGASVVHTFTSALSFTVTETATDSSTPTQTATSSRAVTIFATPPLSTTFQVSSSSPQVGQTVTFTASATGGTSPYTYTVAFGDGGTSAGSSVTYAYTAAGSYTATVTVTDSDSPQASISKIVTVNVQALIPPTLTVLGNQTVTAGTWINFSVTAASGNIGGTITLSATGLPVGASFDPTTGIFSWKPSSSQTGSYTIVFTAMDSSYPSTPTSKSMGIQVNQAAPGGSNGGNGGSSGSSNGSCTLCGIFPKISTTVGLLAIGGLLGLVGALAVLTIRARASLERMKRRLGN